MTSVVFIVYAILVALVFLLAGASGLMIAASAEDHDSAVVGIVLAVFAVPFVVLFGLAAVLPRRPWVWTYDLVLICLGLLHPFGLPFSIALLAFWTKAETKAAFGRAP